ncbi:protein kinase [Thermodesulfobacteriota bacterium]
MSNHNNHTLQAGTVIEDKWIILEFLGKGGMGEVYRAHQLNLKRDIAIKIISREWLDSVEENEEEIEVGLQRFHNEVLSMAQVRHPNLLQIYDYGSFSLKKEPDALKFEYIVMEYIPGGTLRSTMSEDGFYPEESLVKDWVVKYFLPVLDGVQALHTAGIIHRDLKPGNILMDGNTPRITDFGLARSSRIRPVTMSMDIKGTPAYMSPEHFMDLKRADHRSDIYTLGKMFFESIDGKIGTDIIPLKSANLRKAETPFFKKVDQIIRKATAEDRNHRYGSVEEFQSAILEALKIEEPGRIIGKSVKHSILESLSRPKWIWGGVALAVILVMAMTLWHFFGQPREITRIPGGSPPSLSETESRGPLESTATIDKAALSQSVLTGKDGAKLHLIPEGQLSLPRDKIEEPGKSVKINPFYMDETEVTNHQYVEFLNFKGSCGRRSG